MTSETRTAAHEGRGRLGRLFGRGQAAPAAELQVAAPVGGALMPLEALEDGVFSAGILGAGVAVAPDSDVITAPVDGEVVSAMPHAYGIRTDDGVDVLVHIGIDTVELGGTHFVPKVTQSQRVRRGQPLVEVGFAAVREAGYRTSVVVLVTNTPEFASVVPSTAPSARAGEPVLTVHR